MPSCFGPVEENFSPRAVTVTNGSAPINDKGNSPFMSNFISTRKYNWITFPFVNLFMQFQRVANLYFLIIAIFASIPTISPISPITSWLPLLFVLGVTAIREAIEDYKRSVSDREINSREATIYNQTAFQATTWKDLKVGDLVKVENNEFFPADIVVLSTSEEGGACFVETANLDGETNLKTKGAAKDTYTLLTKQTVESQSSLAGHVNGTIHAPAPSNDIFTFDSYMEWKGNKVALGPDQLLMRGCKLRNTGWIVGIVIYSGNDTKVMQNQTKSSMKRSYIERRLNIQIMAVFALLFLCCFICSIGNGVVVRDIFNQWYLDPDTPTITLDKDNAPLSGLVSFFTFLILLSQTIPISLYVTMEVVKSFQAMLIEFDQEIFYEPTQQKTQCRTSNLTEELGSVEYIFSDKTGTLTQNVMEFMKCSINGVIYGQGITEVERAIAKKNGKSLPPADPIIEGSLSFKDDRLTDGRWTSAQDSSLIGQFLLLLGVCHTVQLEESTDKNGNTSFKYQAASPDEGALVEAAAFLGCKFISRSSGHVEVEFCGKKQSFEILAINEFNSTRKRMSMVVRRPDGSLVLLVKGADTVIYERLKANDPSMDVTLEHLALFAEQGLRTLCLAQRELTENDFNRWYSLYHNASCALENREEKLMEVAEDIEIQLNLIGATAIEDKLQVGVADTIQHLADAGIKLWVLTGDKQETAINIGYACAVLTNDMELITITSEDLQEVKSNLINCADRVSKNVASGKPTALVITGGALVHALKPELEDDLLAAGWLCNAVVCCRVSPTQKMLVTKLVKDKKGKITLAIGDGANDVSMIQAAHVGVGIRGLEGMQAALSADYAIAQFRFLERLLLVHGTWSYRRITGLVVYFFYKNIAFAMNQFLYTFYNEFSGRALFDDMYQALYNIVFTSLPIMAYGLLERGVDDVHLLELPKMYLVGQRNELFSWKRFLTFSFGGLIHAILMFYLTVYPWDSASGFEDGKGIDLFSLGTMVCTNVVLVVTFVLALDTRTFTLVHHIFYWGSIIVWFAFVFVYNAMPPGFSGEFDESDNVYNLFWVYSRSSACWLGLVIAVACCLLPLLAYRFFQLRFTDMPSPRIDIVRMMIRAGKPLVVPSFGNKQVDQKLPKSEASGYTAVEMQQIPAAASHTQESDHRSMVLETLKQAGHARSMTHLSRVHGGDEMTGYDFTPSPAGMSGNFVSEATASSQIAPQPNQGRSSIKLPPVKSLAGQPLPPVSEGAGAAEYQQRPIEQNKRPSIEPDQQNNPSYIEA